MRILVTGSRLWNDVVTIEEALLSALDDVEGSSVLVHGAAEGADTIAADIWASWRFMNPGDLTHAEGYPAHLFRSPKARNQHMVDLGADVCLAFARTWASGTGHCARAARKAGIRTIDYGVSTQIEDRP